MKNQYIGGLSKKGGLEQFAGLRWGLGKKEGWCFRRVRVGVLIPQCTLWAVFLEFVQCFFPKLYVVLGFHISGVCDRSVFFRKNRHQGKMIKNGSYTECFGFLGTSSHYFCLEIV